MAQTNVKDFSFTIVDAHTDSDPVEVHIVPDSFGCTISIEGVEKEFTIDYSEGSIRVFQAEFPGADIDEGNYFEAAVQRDNKQGTSNDERVKEPSVP